MTKYNFCYSVDITNDCGTFVMGEPIWERFELLDAIRKAKILEFTINEVSVIMIDEEGNIIKVRNITRIFKK